MRPISVLLLTALVLLALVSYPPIGVDEAPNPARPCPEIARPELSSPVLVKRDERPEVMAWTGNSPPISHLLREIACEPSSSPCYSNVTVHEGDLVIREHGKKVVIRNCKFILKGSLLVLNKSSIFIENASFLLALPSSLSLPNITVTSSSFFAENSTIGTTGLLMAFPFFISGSGVELISSSIGNASISCLSSMLTIRNSTIRKSLDVRGSSDVMVENSGLKEMAIHNSSSVSMRRSQLNYMALWFRSYTELTISGLRPGYVYFWDLRLNCTCKTVFLSVRLEECWVGAWGIGAVGSAILEVLSSKFEDLGAYGTAMVKVVGCEVSCGVLARDRAWIDIISSGIAMIQALDEPFLIVVNSSAGMVMASGAPYVELRNSSISSFSAELCVRAKAINTAFDDVDLSCVRSHEISFTNCTISDVMWAKGLCHASLWNSTVNKLFASGAAYVGLYDSLATNITAKEEARVEVLWSLAIHVFLDDFPLRGAVARAYFSNGTEALNCTTGPGGYCKLYLTERLIRASGEERLGPYNIVVSCGLFWASWLVDPTGPSRREVRFKSLAELEITCLDAGGEPLWGAQVVVASEEGFVNATTDQSGRAVFTDLAPGNYTIEVLWLGLEVARSSIIIHGLDELLKLSCDVIDVLVLVKGPAGPIEGASVSLKMKGTQDVCLTGETNSSGWACIEDAPIGDYELEVGAPGFKPYTGDVSLSSPGQVIEIVLEPLPREGEGLPWVLLLATILPVAVVACGALILKKRRGRASSS